MMEEIAVAGIKFPISKIWGMETKTEDRDMHRRPKKTERGGGKKWRNNFVGWTALKLKLYRPLH